MVCKSEAEKVTQCKHNINAYDPDIMQSPIY